MAFAVMPQQQLVHFGISRNDGFSRLPIEVHTYLLSFLPIEDIYRCVVVSKAWKEICYSEDFYDIFVKSVQKKMGGSSLEAYSGMRFYEMSQLSYWNGHGPMKLRGLADLASRVPGNRVVSTVGQLYQEVKSFLGHITNDRDGKVFVCTVSLPKEGVTIKLSVSFGHPDASRHPGQSNASPNHFYERTITVKRFSSLKRLPSRIQNCGDRHLVPHFPLTQIVESTPGIRQFLSDVGCLPTSTSRIVQLVTTAHPQKKWRDTEKKALEKVIARLSTIGIRQVRLVDRSDQKILALLSGLTAATVAMAFFVPRVIPFTYSS